LHAIELRLEQGVSTAEVARGLELSPNVLRRWRQEFRAGTGNAFPGSGKQRRSDWKLAELERKIGQQTLEIDLLKGCLQRVEEQRMLQALTGNPPSSPTGKLMLTVLAATVRVNVFEDTWKHNLRVSSSGVCCGWRVMDCWRG
jgi:transposase